MALLPETGYRGNVYQSLIALCWLNEINSSVEIDYRLSAKGERKILDRYVDGFSEENNTVYLFHGCLSRLSDYNPVLNETYFNSHNKAKYILISLLRSNRYLVVEKWECDYVLDIDDKWLKNQKSFLYSCLSLDPKDALFDGRTSPANLFYDVKDDEKILYYDFTSLYPSVQ